MQKLLVFVFLQFFLLTFSSYSEKFKVGLSIPLSGALAEYGIAAQNGLELAQKDHPDLFTNIEFVYFDNKYESKTAITALRQLQAIHKVKLVYSWGNPISEAVAPIAERDKLPIIAMSSDPKITKNRKFIIRTVNSTEHYALKLANYLNKTHYKNIAVVVFENSYVLGLYEGLIKHLNQEKKLTLLDTYVATEKDFKATLSKMKNKKYDCLGVLLISGQVSSFYKQLRTFGFKDMPTFGADFLDSKNEIKNAGGAMEGAVYPNTILTEKFRKRYLSTYGNETHIAFAGNAYDVARLIGVTFSKDSRSLTAEEIITRIKQSGDLQGAAEKFAFKETDIDGPYLDFPLGIMQIEGEGSKQIF